MSTAFPELTAPERAGQLVMTGTPVGDPAARRTLVRTYRLGGVFLAGRSSRSAAATRSALAQLAAVRTTHATVKPLVAIDQEGGKVQTLRGGGWATIPSALVQGRWSTATLAARTAAWATALHAAGISMDLAPVADTVPAGTAPDNPPIGVFGRQYGSSPATVARSVATVSTALKQAGVIPVVKHFPGLGRVRANTDTSTRAVDRTTTVTDPYLAPFAAGVSAGAGAVMVSSATYPKLDPDHLAVFSPAVITGLLRGRMHYQGVVMTDDIGKAVAVRSVPPAQRAVRFVEAGGDLILTVPTAEAAPMVKALIARAAVQPAFRAEVDAAAARVLTLKLRAGLLTCH